MCAIDSASTRTPTLHQGFNKLYPRYFCPFYIEKKLGSVAYKLNLTEGCLIHLVFHVSYLKGKLGSHIVPISTLPPVDFEGALQPEPNAVL